MELEYDDASPQLAKQMHFFVATIKFNIAAAETLLSDHRFQYVLPAVFGQGPLENFFGNARQRFGGNFYIDIKDVLAAAKVQRLYQLAMFDIVYQGHDTSSAVDECALCDKTPDDVYTLNALLIVLLMTQTER